MSWGFEVGRVYNRRKDIHARFEGQERSGIITPRKHPVVIIITGDIGLQHGYHDRLRDDGVFEYYGEGQTGDMTMNGGNKVLADHSINGKGLLLFKKAGKDLIFEGEMVCETYRYERGKDRLGKDRRVIVFELRRLENLVEEIENAPGQVAKTSIEELRKRAQESASVGQKTSSVGVRTVYQRSRDIRDYVLVRAKGHCEGCTAPAPFDRKDGSPYLEPHHIRRVSDGGPDHPDYVIALCPNCHRRVHAGADGATYNERLLKSMSVIEPAN